jgi:hypothetical protein
MAAWQAVVMMKVSSLALVLANLVPVGGVLLLDWQVYDVLLLYWAENVVIGIINVARMAACKGGIGIPRVTEQQIQASLSDTQAAKLSLISKGLKFFLIPFFIFHYGMFCFGHFAAINAIFGDELNSASVSLLVVVGSWDKVLWLAILAIFASHMISFFLNFIGGQEYQRTDLRQLMQRPYGRIIALHLTVILGAGLTMWLGSPIYMLVVLVAIKIGIDLKMHTAERQKFSIS